MTDELSALDRKRLFKISLISSLGSQYHFVKGICNGSVSTVT